MTVTRGPGFEEVDPPGVSVGRASRTGLLESGDGGIESIQHVLYLEYPFGTALHPHDRAVQDPLWQGEHTARGLGIALYQARRRVACR
jgi:hypothetical protein